MRKISEIIRELREIEGYSIEEIEEKFGRYRDWEEGKFDEEFREQWQRGELDPELEDDLREISKLLEVDLAFLKDPFGSLHPGRLKKLLKARGWSDKQFADCLKEKGVKVSQAAVFKWRRGTAAPSVRKLRQLAELFGVSVDYLLGLSDYPKVLELRSGKGWRSQVIPLDQELEKAVYLFEQLISGKEFTKVIRDLKLEFREGVRLLKEALDSGLVEVDVEELEYDENLADFLRQKFGLREVIIVKVSHLPQELGFLLIGEVAAHFFATTIRSGQKIALSGGRTIRRMVMSLRHYKGRSNLSGLELYPLDVCPLPEIIDVHSNTLIGLLKYILEENNVRAYGILNPGFLAPGEESFWPPTDRDVHRVLLGARNADAVFVGIGALAILGPTTLRIRLESEGYNILSAKEDLGVDKEGCLITKEPLDKVREKVKKNEIKEEELAVGDILFHLFNINGQELKEGEELHPFNKRIPSIPLKDLQNLAKSEGVPVVAVAMGAEKGTAVYAALKGGYVNTLIADDSLANAIITLYSRRGYC